MLYCLISQPWLLPDIKKRDFELKVALVSAVETGFRGVREVCAILEERLGVDNFSMTSAQAQAFFGQVLVPHFKCFLRDDMRDAPFSLVLDDAGNVTRDGEVGAAIYYFSRSRQRAVSTYLGLVRIDRDDINVLVESINALLHEWELRGANLVALLTDGVAEICGDREALVTLLVPTCPNVLHLSSSFSSLSNAFHAAVKKSLPASIEFMLRESFNWFADSGERQHRYADVVEQVGFARREEVARQEEEEREERRREADEVQVAQKRKRGRPPKIKPDPEEEETMEVSELENDELLDDALVLDDAISDEPSSRLRRIRPDAMQWLAIADYTTGLFLHYDALKVHFERAAETDGCYAARLLNKEFCDEHNRLYFTVLQPMLTEISDLKQHLEAKEAAARAAADHPHDEEAVAAGNAAGGSLCEQIETLFVNLASQVLKPTVVSQKSVDELCQVDASASSADALGVNQVNYGPNFTTILDASPLPASEKNKIKSAAASFLRELFSGLQTVLRNALLIIRAAEHFQLPNFLEVSVF